MKLSTRALLHAGGFWLAMQLAPVHAFSLNDPGHGGITRDALALSSITIGGETLKFTDRTKEETFEVDHHQLTGDGSGNTTFDAIGVGAASAQVRAERSGQGDGRVYRIAFDAFDGKGGQCSGNVKVEVPHDNRISAPDSGSGINSLGIR